MAVTLDERKKKILKAIIRTYMETGEPVGSRTISKYADLNVSSATIRNEMSDLTDMGYIIQPHTSAGRIPSDKGYRLYVDELMKEKEEEISEIREMMIEKTDKMEKMLVIDKKRRDFLFKNCIISCAFTYVTSGGSLPLRTFLGDALAIIKS